MIDVYNFIITPTEDKVRHTANDQYVMRTQFAFGYGSGSKTAVSKNKIVKLIEVSES